MMPVACLHGGVSNNIIKAAFFEADDDHNMTDAAHRCSKTGVQIR